jgi:hypothetical protein
MTPPDTLDDQSAPIAELPPGIRLVAWMFMGLGVLGLVSIAATLIEGPPVINVAFLGIFIGRGLLRGGWRTGAMIFVLVALVWIASAILSLVTAEAPRYVLLVPVGGLAMMLLWMFRVLLRRDVRQFYEARAAAAAAGASTDFPQGR